MTRTPLLLLVAAVFAHPPRPPVLPRVAISDTTVGISVNQDLRATGGVEPLTYLATGVPAGLTFDAGILSGSPTAAGNVRISVTVTDAIQHTDTQRYPFTVYAAPVFQATGIPDAIVGTSYSVQFAMTGGEMPFTYVATSADLPPELTFDAATGTLSGTPAATGTFSITVQATDVNGASVSRTFSAQILEKLQIVTTSLPPGSVGVAYSELVQVLGGEAPIAFSVPHGLLPPGLSLGSATGRISGTPTTAGTFTFTVKVKDASNSTATANLTLQILPRIPLQVTTTTLAYGVVGAAYSETLAATGGRTPYTWSVTAGSLPAGITLSVAGALTGAPTAAGTYAFAVTVTDPDGQAASASLTLTVYATLLIGSEALPDGYAGDGYAFNFSATGGRAPYLWSLAAGSLPNGLTLTSGGALAGTPTAAGTFAFTVQVADGSAQTAIRSVNLSVLPPLAVTNDVLADGRIGVPYSETLFARGGKAPYSFSIAGSLPAGITASGPNLSGTPTTAGQSTFTVTVTDGNGKTASKDLSIQIWGLVVTTPSLPDGYATVPYAQTLTVVGGTPPYTWSVTGTLPQGIVLSGDQIAGTPISSGTFSFSVQVTDSQSATAAASLTLRIAPALAVTTPSLPDAYVGDAYAATLAAAGGLAPYAWDLASGSLPPGITLAGDSLSGAATAPGTSAFVVRATDQNSTAATQALSITVSSLPSIVTTSLPDGYVGLVYSATLSATGGRTPYTWTVSSGALPPGLGLNGTTGVVEGTPTGGGGSYSFSVTVSDAGGKLAVQALAVNVSASPTIVTTGPFPVAYGGESYAQPFLAEGGVPPYHWSVSGGVPAGLTMDPTTGVLSGTLAASVGNNFSNDFTVTATDSKGIGGNAPVSIVSFRLPQLMTTSLDTATEGITYRHASGAPVQVTADLGLPPYVFSAVGLPPGLAMEASGIISGIPGKGSAGNYPVNVTLTDSNGRGSGRTLPMTVVAVAPIAGGGWYSVQPQGSPVTEVLTVFAIDSSNRPLPGIGIRIQKNGADYTPVREALTDASGQAFFSGLGLNGTTDTISLTGNGLGYQNTSVASVNAALVTLMMSSAPVPSPRQGSPLLYDASLGKLLLFGGAEMDPNIGPVGNSAMGCVTDVVRLDTVDSAGWTEVFPAGMAGAPALLMNRQAAALGGGTSVFFGGMDCTSYYRTGGTWTFSSGKKTWTALMPALSPTDRYNGAMVAEPSGNTALLFGGNNGTYTNDLWRFTLATSSWKRLTPTGGPPNGRERMGYAMRTATSDFWICGGRTKTGETADCWSYNTASNVWTSRPALPQPRSELAMAYDSAYATLYAFGGASGGVARNDLLALPSGAPAWTTVTADGLAGAPSRRRMPQMAYVPPAGELVVFGGISDALTFPTAIGDTWTYHPARGWAQRNVESTSPTVTISGNITGGYPTGLTRGYIEVGIAGGGVLSTSVNLTNGSGQYRISGIKAGSTLAVQAIAKSPAGAGLPGNTFSFYSVTGIGPLAGDTIQNIAFPGQVPTLTSTFTLLRPADWVSTGNFGGTPLVRPAGYPSLRSGFATPINFAAGRFEVNHYTLPGAANTAVFSGTDNTPGGCEYSDRYLSSFTPGSLGTFQLPEAQHGMRPGQNPCTPEGFGFSPGLADYTGMAPRALAVGAFVGNDLALDVAIADSASDTVTLYQGDGIILDPSGWDDWFSPGSVATGPGPAGIAIADLVGDSNPDLAVITSGDNSLRIYTGDGNGFPGVVDTYTADIVAPIALAAADVTRDGQADLVVLNGDGTVVTYRNRGFGQPFTSTGAVPLGGPATAMALGDYSGDTVPDLAVTIPTPVPHVELRMADPMTGAFTILGQTLSTDPDPASVAFGDYTGDGWADLVVGHAPGAQVLSFENVGGAFSLPEALSVGSDVPAIGLGDVTSDGRTDLLLATETLQSLTVYERSAGTWNYSRSYDNWPGVRDLEIADLNADGAADVLTANSGNDTFSTFMNQRPLPTAPDAQFTLVAPADAKLAYVYRGTYKETYAWTMVAPAAAGPLTYVFPPPSTLAPSRLLPSGQRASWDPRFYLYDTAAPFNYQDTRFHGGYYGSTATQTYGYIRE